MRDSKKTVSFKEEVNGHGRNMSIVSCQMKDTVFIIFDAIFPAHGI